MSVNKKKLLIFIITYKASFRLLDVFKKIPFKKLSKYKTSILISDDFSNDNTIEYAINIKKKFKNKTILVNENKKNLGYGGNIKKCLNYSINKKFDYAVMIHGDGQYDPKYIPNLLKKLSIRNNSVISCTGSRLLNGVKGATKGGMPIFKLLGNIFLTKIFNFLISANFSDAHTGLWSYNLRYLKNKNFSLLTSGFNFDNEFRFMSLLQKKSIIEIPIKTKYGDERSQLHIMYAIKFFFNSFIFFFIKIGLLKNNKFKN